jgi:hypothetical protein
MDRQCEMGKAMAYRRKGCQWSGSDTKYLATPGPWVDTHRALGKTPQATPYAFGWAALKQHPAGRVNQNQHDDLSCRAGAPGPAGG